MNKQISFKLWLKVFFGGIWQLILKLFTPKYKTMFGKAIWCIIASCAVIITSLLCIVFYREVRYGHTNYYDRTYLGPDLFFYDCGVGKSYILNKESKEKTLKGIDWVVQSVDGDSLAVYAKEGKRGFVSRNTGKVVIPARYDAAWCFNDGVAAVCEGDSVFFIDHAGKPINNRKYKRKKDYDYVYYGEYFANYEDGKYGLVDRKGNDATPAIYTELLPMPNNMWKMSYNHKSGVINDKGIIVVPNEHYWIDIYPEGGIVAVAEDHSMKRMDYDGNVIDDFVFEYTESLEYATNEIDKEGERIKKAANLDSYVSFGYYGLIDKNGKPVTPPLYNSIHAYSADLFECQIFENSLRVMLNSKGEKVN